MEEFTNEISSEKDMARQNRVLNFIEKDLYIVNNHETAPFKNRKHAIECLLPYNLFNVSADDTIYNGCNVDVDMRSVVGETLSKIKELSSIKEAEGFTPQLLRYHELMYYKTYMEKRLVDLGGEKTRYCMKMRLPKSDAFYITGSYFQFRINLRKLKDDETN